MVDNISRTEKSEQPYPLPSEVPVKSSEAGKTEGKQEAPAAEESSAVSGDRKDEIAKAMENLAAKFKEAGASQNVMDILTKVMANLRKMTQTIQQLATTQADEITLETQMQAFYTNVIKDIPIYNTTTNPPPSVLPPLKPEGWWKNKDNASALLNEVGIANSEMNNLTETTKNFRDLHGARSKEIQTAISTSDDAQKEMLDFLQTLLQKQREWVAGFRSP